VPGGIDDGYAKERGQEFEDDQQARDKKQDSVDRSQIGRTESNVSPQNEPLHS
jgi:hypothetical protein